MMWWDRSAAEAVDRVVEYFDDFLSGAVRDTVVPKDVAISIADSVRWDDMPLTFNRLSCIWVSFEVIFSGPCGLGFIGC